MKKWFGKRFKKALIPPSLTESKVIVEAIKILQVNQSDNTGMGFHKLEKTAQSIVNAQRILEEHGVNLTSQELEQLVQYMQDLQAYKQAYIRLVVQLILTFIVIAGAISFIAFKNPSDEVIKALLILIATIIGYWFFRSKG
ncbi:hypothetical protein [Thiolinea disciformis]|uniref:hypothetical protein n=1 Tax=Thiolinea disciformis TaxID=125614 RepID=UPI00035FF4F1|nr:hypothetical protein [Thiolinea disciformis]